MKRPAIVPVAAAILWWSCAGEPVVTECSTADDCDDEIECTLDVCEVGGVCGYQPVDSQCEEGATCDPERGCVSGGCTAHDQCDDGLDCTTDLCAVGGVCENQPDDSACPDGQRCDLELGCLDAGCTSDDACDDGIGCTTDLCTIEDGYGTCLNAPDDGACADGEHCTEGVGCMGDCETSEDCDDGDFCNGEELCEPEFGCRPAETPRDCNDNVDCTIDRCDADLDQCVYDIDPAIPECNTFDPAVHLNGCFDIVPTVSQTCALGMVSYSFSQVCFALEGGIVLTMTASGIEQDLIQTPAPVGASFDVSVLISGGCNEDYRMTGTFSDANHFSGTWTSVFTGAGCYGLCANLTIPVTATRATGP